MGSLNLDLNNVNLDSNFDECDPDTIISVRILLGILNLKNTKLFLKKNKWIIDANSVAY